MSSAPSPSESACVRSIRTTFPYRTEKNTKITIELSNGIKLAATAWIPHRQEPDDSLKEPQRFVTILEYLPYRKADWTSQRDELRLKYFASFGYVSLRVDIRGTGNSQGYFDDEYSVQELSDGLEILRWIEQQPWSNGKVVVFGKSWGGFNGLQLASLGPRNLCGVISAYSTDDRYSDDIHYVGGCLAAQEALAWSTQMLLWLAMPPHPVYQGGIEQDADLFEIWKDRLEHLVPLDTYWIKHQTRDAYWRHGSVGEDYSRIQCPVLLIGGFADLYTDPVFRLMDHLTCPKRAIIGPWGHQWPDDAYPGPQIGFLQEVVQWLDYHLKGIDNHYGQNKLMTVYQMEPNCGELQSIVNERKGQWIDTDSIPGTPGEHAKKNGLSVKERFNEEQQMKFYVWGKCLRKDPPVEQTSSIRLQSSQETGLNSGNLLGWGYQNSPDNALDQREDDAKSLSFDSSPINQPLELFGFPLLRLSISSNQTDALLCARLCLIDEATSSSILLSRGFLNLTHHQSHENPQSLEIDHFYTIEMKLSSVCVKIQPGHRLRLSLSTTYWPIVWPSPQPTALTIHFNDSEMSWLTLPLLHSDYIVRKDFDSPEVAPGIETKILRNSSSDRIRTIDEVNDMVELKISEDDGAIEFPDGLIFDEKSERIFRINKHDAQSARVAIKRTLKYSFGTKFPLNVDIQLQSQMHAEPSPSAFHVQHHLVVRNQNEEVFDRCWNLTFSRTHQSSRAIKIQLHFRSNDRGFGDLLETKEIIDDFSYYMNEVLGQTSELISRKLI